MSSAGCSRAPCFLRAIPVLGVLLATACGESGPHVFLISIDTLRADHVGLYGYPRDTTPNLDRFFAQGTVFDNPMSTAPCTLPSVRQFLSGGFDIRPSRKPLAELLRERGYRTAAIVSQHQFHHETARDYARGFDHFDMQRPDETDHHGLTTRTADEVSDRALDWLEAQPPGEPLFLWLHYFDPHDPYEPPAGFRDFDAGYGSERSGDRRLQVKQALGSAPEPFFSAAEIFSDEDVAHFINLYDGEIRFTDHQIGRVLDALERSGRISESIVALISDHGEWLGEDGWWDHCQSLREEEVRVPFMLRARGGPLNSSARGSLPASTIDLVPTILGLVGIENLPNDYHGEDLRGAPTGRVVLAMWEGIAVARNRDWKLYVERAPTGLFQITRDPHERSNVLAQQPGVRTALARRVATAKSLRRRVDAEWEETVRLLKRMGYVE